MTEQNKTSKGKEQKKEGTENKKKESAGNVSVVLKANLHCEGCVSKVLKCIRTFDANIGDGQITVVGKIDPAKLRERVEKKTHKKVEVVSPQTKNGEKAEKKKEPPQEKNTTNAEKSDYKEPPVTTAQLKVHLHCEGCIQKIRKIIVKTKGYRDMQIDKQKEMVTVTGALDMKALAEVLKKHLKREVQIVAAKKETEKKESENGKGGAEKGNGGLKAEKMEGNNKMHFQVGYPYPDPFYNPYAYGSTHAPQLFSDENPNACSLM
ncbi:heavy metal-associated isoprenylated plant protein 3-like isoform X2 [Salvia splendens]|uniref:heavy metal-associated isoprenylated plant protein 3-like isoform X2 n=1 Tax=Salvia splendens TaxID=180675 RepID=UPI001C260EEE|nr:heavy metal-associated isoprenylated plant protein 3-like isoform X2 [Salvia splendens]